MNWAAYIGLFIGEAAITSYLLWEVSRYKCRERAAEPSFWNRDIRDWIAKL